MPKLIDGDSGGAPATALDLPYTRESPCLTPEDPGLAPSIIAVESRLPATLLHQRKHRVDRRRCDLDEPTHFLDGGDEGIDLQGPASFEILQH